MKIRLAVPSDAVAIAGLHASSWRQTYRNVLSEQYLKYKALEERKTLWLQRFTSPKEGQCVLVVEGLDGIVGFACVFAAEHAQWGSYLDNLHISESYHGQGLGRALLVEIVKWCEHRIPGQGLYLSVNQSNHKAQRFYIALGARNAEPGVWNAPDGSAVPTYWFLWESAAALVATSVKGT